MHTNKLQNNLVVCLLITLGTAYIIYSALQKPIGDFGNYYYAAQFMVQGKWGLWIYDSAAFNLAIYNCGQRDFFLSYTAVPPLTTVLFLPFTVFNVITAKLVWNVINVGLLVVTLYSMQQFFLLKPKLILGSLLLFFMALLNNINQGQGYFLLLFLIWFGYKAHSNNNKWLAALLWAFAFHLKIIPGLLALIYVCNKDVKGLFYYVTAVVVLLLVSLPAVTMPVWINYITNILPQLQQGYINNPFALSYQSVDVLLRKLFVFDELLNPTPWHHNTNAFTYLSNAFKLFIVLVTAVYLIRNNNHKKQIGLIAIAMLLISGYGNSFSLLLLIIPLFVVLADEGLSKNNKIIFVCLTAYCCLIPIYWFVNAPLLIQFTRLYVLLTVFAFYVKLTSPKYLSPAYFTALLALFLPNKQQAMLGGAVDKNPLSLLAYDFDVTSTEIIIYYFDDAGIKIKSVTPSFTISTIEKIIDAENRKQIIVNRNKKLYLSDKGRGIGFYTLRIDVYDKK